MMALISADIASCISFHPPSYHPRFHFLTDLNFKPGFYVFIFCNRDVQPLFRKWARTFIVGFFAERTFKNDKRLTKIPILLCNSYIICMIYIYIYIHIYLIYKYRRGSHNPAWRAALWTAILYIIETRCEILVTLRPNCFF